MKIVPQSFEIVDEINGSEILKKLEKIGRIAYKSEDKITDDSCFSFVKGIIKRGHESVLEHVSITVKVIIDRGISHEIVRHRIASYTQESTRYCNYRDNKFGKEISVISPFGTELDALRKGELFFFNLWLNNMALAEQTYEAMVDMKLSPQIARSVLPNSLKTELYMTMNLREWRHFFKLRTAQCAHPQMQELAKMILKEFQKLIPIIFEDLLVE